MIGKPLRHHTDHNYLQRLLGTAHGPSVARNAYAIPSKLTNDKTAAHPLGVAVYLLLYCETYGIDPRDILKTAERFVSEEEDNPYSKAGQIIRATRELTYNQNHLKV